MNNKDTKLIWEAVVEAAPVQFDPEIELPPVPEVPGMQNGGESKTPADRVDDRHIDQAQRRELEDKLNALNDWVDDKLDNVRQLTDDQVEDYTIAVQNCLDALEPVGLEAPEQLEDPTAGEDLYPGGEDNFAKDMADFGCPLPPGPDSF